MRKKHNETKYVALLLIMVSVLSLGFGGQALAQTLGPLFANDLVIGTAEVPGGALPAAVFDGTRYLVVWGQYYDQNSYYYDVYGRFINTQGQPEGDPFLICHRPGGQGFDLSLAFNGTNFLVAWYEGWGPTANNDTIRGQLVDRSGNLVGNEKILSTYQPINGRPSVASDGTDFLVIWQSNEVRTTYGDIYGQKVSGAGALFGTNFLITPGTRNQQYPTLGFGGGKYLVIWQESSASNQTPLYIYGAFVDPNGISTPFPISTSLGSKSAWGGDGISWDGNNFLVVWRDLRSGSEQVYGTRMTPSGNLLDGPSDSGGIQISSSGWIPRAVFNGTNWLVTWTGNGKIWGTRINSDGSKYDAAAILISKANYCWSYPGALAFDGANYLVAWGGASSSNSPHYLYAQIVGPVAPVNLPPLANAGTDKSVHLGAPVILDGSKSSDPDGDSLTYSWSFAPKPGGSNATLSNPTTMNPSFTPDVLGDYVVQLVVTDSHGLASAPATVKITTGNTAPVADAGPNQVIQVQGTTVTLNGSNSSDADGDPLTFQWTMVSQPDGSKATLPLDNTAFPTFVADVHGTYRAQLVVKDPWSASTPVTMEVTFDNIAPVAKAGSPQAVTQIDTTVTLDGSGSYDANGDLLTYAWSITAKPPESLATLNNANSARPFFVADKHGTYVAQLTVSDGFDGVSSDTVTVSFTNVLPMAEAGDNQAVAFYGATVTLDGSKSYDDNGDKLTYAWSLLAKPAGSVAQLSDTTAVTPTFVADMHGDYNIQLIVNDGFGGTATDTVTVSFDNLLPVADAGSGGTFGVGQRVTLDGSRSSDPNHDPLTFKWSIISRPAGSATAIVDPAAPVTSLMLDAKGDYQVQLVVNDGVVNSAAQVISFTATLDSRTVISEIQNLQGTIRDKLIGSVFKNDTMKNALINKLSSVATNIETGKYQEALGQLQHDLLAKTDGYATTGQPDKNDWIKDPAAQTEVYNCLMTIITEVKALSGQP